MSAWSRSAVLIGVVCDFIVRRARLFRVRQFEAKFLRMLFTKRCTSAVTRNMLPNVDRRSMIGTALPFSVIDRTFDTPIVVTATTFDLISAVMVV